MTSQSVQALHLQHPGFRAFIERYPQYRYTSALDQIRLREFSRLDEQGEVYLDYTGACPYPATLIEQHREILLRGVFGNTHSAHHAASASTALQLRARDDVLRYFNADPEEYAVIFTANASGALRLIGESYPFDENAEFLLTADNHNSVNGIREYAHRRGAKVRYIPSMPGTLRVDDIVPRLAASQARGNGLLAYPAQSNFSGVQHPLEWIDAAHTAGYDVLLDAAAFVPTNRLDLARTHPDFVALSFYKMFGYPTGIGALIARHSALRRLVRPSFSGGTVKIVSTLLRSHALHEDESAFEDGTVNYLGFPAVSTGLNFLASAGIETIHRRVAMLADYLLETLRLLRHSNGRPAIEIYGDANPSSRGGTVAFNMRDPSGAYVNYAEVERQAARDGIALRSGCFCNPGAGEAALSHTVTLIEECLRRSGPELDLAGYRACLDRSGKTMGAVRASLGMASNFSDVYRLSEFLGGMLDRSAADIALQK
ncbi:MAG: aminotransferase class V-fold PLP-dependent enzyme [Gammaproteobacteria bacterium]|nr:aminotransferase class V-fold PLP-dependent enzyme [Gammaproteobacteria bacterium]